MMKIFSKKELLCGVFGAVGDLTSGSPGLLAADADGLRLPALDPSSVLHAEARIPRALLWACESDGGAGLAVDLQKLKNFVGAGAKGGEWELSTGQDERGPLLFLKNGGLAFTTRPLPRESARNIGPLKFDFAASLEAPAEGLRGLLKTLRNAKGEADAVALRVENGGLSLRVCDGDAETLASLSLEPFEVSARGEGATWLSCELLAPALSKLLGLRPEFIRLELVQGGPARLTAHLEGGGEVAVLMAPREAPEGNGQEESPQEEGPTGREEAEAPPDEPEEALEEAPEGVSTSDEGGGEEPPGWEVAAPIVSALLWALSRSPAPGATPSLTKCPGCGSSMWGLPGSMCDPCRARRGPGGPAVRPEVAEAVRALEAWLPSETGEFRRLVASLLAALPGGEPLEEMGVEPAPVGWKEVELLGDLLHAIQDSGDVGFAVQRLFGQEAGT